MDPQNETRAFLLAFDDFCKHVPMFTKYRPHVASLLLRLQQPCVLAIAGKVKAGKSSFLNALLGKELAKVGTEETTATINIFRHISEADNDYSPDRPVRVHWDSGVCSFESLDFMNSLQGHDEETLRKAQGISFLEFYENNDFLRNVTLVDTPGTGAAVTGHQQVVDRYLREKHHNQTLDCTAKADAIIFLVGAVAEHQNQSFLNDFRSLSEHSSALNALGVLSKIDVELLGRQYEQASYIAQNMKEQLFTVVPVSSGIYLACQRYRDHFASWQALLKDIPQPAFKYLFEGEEFFLESNTNVSPDIYAKCLKSKYGDSDYPIISLEQRRSMRGDLPWAIFRTICSQLYDSDSVDQAERNLYDIANIDGVKQAINNQFFNRSLNIRCFHVLDELKKIADSIQYEDFYSLRRNCNNKDIWKQAVRDGSPGKPKDVMDNLIAFIDDLVPSADSIRRLEQQFFEEIVEPLDVLRLKLEEYDRNYRMLLLLQNTKMKWNNDDYLELCQVFGLGGSPSLPQNVDPCRRQLYWNEKTFALRNSEMKEIAEQAVRSYGILGGLNA